MEPILKTDKHLRLGIWGLGRGAAFIKAANDLNIDIVAGCDTNPIMREQFRKTCPDAFITADDTEFLAYKDMDAVLVATYFPCHAEHSIRALEAGFHVMCEVTSFTSPGEGVRLLEAVEKSGKVYNLLENYPFSKENMYLEKLWKEGFFGEFQYGEFNYLHNCRMFSYKYCLPPDFPPIEPGYTVHSWRSWLNFHYYNTHSLGPIMKITGLRPERVTAPPTGVSLPGFIPESENAKVAVALIQMSNGGIMRNLIGNSTSDNHTDKRIWGTKAAAESLGHGLHIRLGATGFGPNVHVEPQWPFLGDFADQAGHGGGDFWELYYFAREVLENIPAPWNIYEACDVTLAGIMAVRSQEANGMPMEIPDFRNKDVREQFRNDFRGMTRSFDPQKIFPEGHDTTITSRFNFLMINIETLAMDLRTALDGAVIYEQIPNPADRLTILETLKKARRQVPVLTQYMEEANAIVARYPGCLAAEALKSMMSLADTNGRDPAELLDEKLDWALTVKCK